MPLSARTRMDPSPREATRGIVNFSGLEVIGGQRTRR